MFSQSLALSVCLSLSAFSSQPTFMEKAYNFSRSIYEEVIEPFSNLSTIVPNFVGAVIKMVPQKWDQMTMKQSLFNFGIGQNFDKAQEVDKNTPWPKFGWNEARKVIQYCLGLELNRFVFSRVAERKNSQMLKVLLKCSNIAAAANFLVALQGYFSKNKRAEAFIRLLNSVNKVADCISINNFQSFVIRNSDNIDNLSLMLLYKCVKFVWSFIFTQCFQGKAASAVKFMQGSYEKRSENEKYVDVLKTSALCKELAASSFLILYNLALFHSLWMPYFTKGFHNGFNFVKNQGVSLISYLRGQSA